MLSSSKFCRSRKKQDEALEIAERGRARAFVELLASKLDSKPKEQLDIPPNIDKIKQIAKTENATLVEYSIIYDEFKIQGKQQAKESNLYIWVVKLTGEVVFCSVDLTPLNQQKISLENLVVNNLSSISGNSNTTERGEINLNKGDRVRLKDDNPSDPAWEVLAVNTQTGTLALRQPSYSPGFATEHPIGNVAEKIGANNSQSSPNAKNLNLHELYQRLVQPIADLLPKKQRERVIFIPQTELFLVPFPALQDEHGKYLIEKHTILTAPAIQVLDLTHKQRQKVAGTNKDALVIGNPTMPKVSLYPGQPPTQLASLPNAEIEAKEVAKILKTDAIIGNQASKSAILPQLLKARIIHLATHGLLDDFTGGGVPGAIALAPSGQDQGLLTASVILDLKLNAELVVLSACNTGRGRITGDGVIGLSRSLISAGVPSVIVSLWSVPDAPTGLLMEEFYRQLQQNPDKATALRQAMLMTIKEHPEPKDWAAFTLIGESQ